jgi:hypothetical protein
MPVLLVGKNVLGARGAENYRGTYRGSPTHCDELPEDSEYNQLFRWYCDEDYRLGGLEDLGKARRFLKLLREELGQQQFELIEGARIGEVPRIGGELLGYDLSAVFSYSLLSWGLDLSKPPEAPQPPAAIQDLSALVEAHFKPLLNEHCLFSDGRTAAFCLRSMMAMQALSPGLWESEDFPPFEVIAIFRIADGPG